jgi:hypothetical protein
MYFDLTWHLASIMMVLIPVKGDEAEAELGKA